MSVGTKYTAITRVERPATYTCTRCGFTSPVTVIGLGNASANAAHLLDNHASAEARARANAALDAEADVPRMLGLVPCPQCGKRDPAFVRGFYRKHISAVAGLVLALCFLAMLVFGRGGAGPFFISWAVMSAIGAGVYHMAVDPKFEWTRASLCVKFQKV